MKKLLMMLVVMNVLALGGLVGYLVATGRLDGVKAGAIVDLLKHKGTPGNLREELYEILETTPATTSAPATMAGVQAGDESRPESVLAVSATDRIDYARQAVEQERLRLQSEAQELRHRQELLEQLQREVQAKLGKIEEEKKKFEEQVVQVKAATKDDNFQKTLALYDELKPKQVKELFIGMPANEVAEYLQAMEAARAAKIIGEFKTPAERGVISKVLELIRVSGTGDASSGEAAGPVGARAGT